MKNESYNSKQKAAIAATVAGAAAAVTAGQYEQGEFEKYEADFSVLDETTRGFEDESEADQSIMDKSHFSKLSSKKPSKQLDRSKASKQHSTSIKKDLSDDD